MYWFIATLIGDDEAIAPTVASFVRSLYCVCVCVCSLTWTTWPNWAHWKTEKRREYKVFKVQLINYNLTNNKTHTHRLFPPICELMCCLRPPQTANCQPVWCNSRSKVQIRQYTDRIMQYQVWIGLSVCHRSDESKVRLSCANWPPN